MHKIIRDYEFKGGAQLCVHFFIDFDCTENLFLEFINEALRFITGETNIPHVNLGKVKRTVPPPFKIKKKHSLI